MTRLYEARCRVCGQCAVLHGYCRMCGTPQPSAAAATNQPVLDDVPPTVEPTDAPESRTDAPPAADQPPEGYGPYDDDYPAHGFDLGAGG